MSAAIALREMRTPAGVAALQEALSDPQELVRHHAAASLLVMHGIQRADSWKDNPLTIDIMSDNKVKQEKAIAEIEKLLRERGTIEIDTP